MFCVIAINRGMWGTSSVVTREGRPELYPTRQEAEEAADRLNRSQGPVNRFTDYFAEEYRAR